MPTVYIETSIPSYYFETRRTIQAAAWRKATRRWWSEYQGQYELVTSAFVFAELSDAPETKSAPGLALLQAVRVLPKHPDDARTIDEYIRQRVMPADAEGDAAHLAMASLYGIDFLLTWNCKHLANANKVGHIRKVNEGLLLRTPILTTPLGLIPENDT